MEGLRCKCEGESIAHDYDTTVHVCSRTHGISEDSNSYMKYCYGAAKDYCDLEGRAGETWNKFKEFCKLQGSEVGRKCDWDQC